MSWEVSPHDPVKRDDYKQPPPLPDLTPTPDPISVHKIQWVKNDYQIVIKIYHFI